MHPSADEVRPQVDLTWVAVGPGRLALFHRPRLRSIALLRDAGCDHVVTLLSEREGAAVIGDLVQRAALRWTWIPLPNANPPAGAERVRVVSALPLLARELDQGVSLLIHCSAGIHRTGMVAFALLRWYGYTEQRVLDLIAAMRMHTFNGLTPQAIAWGNAVVAEEGSTWSP